MATITVQVEDYEGLKTTVHQLNQDIVNLRHENTVLKDTVSSTLDILEILEDVSLFERIFKWDETHSMLKEYFKTLTAKIKNL